MDDLPPSARESLPNARWLMVLSVLLLAAFSAVTGWVLAYEDDPQTKGILVGSWISIATAVSAFWFGSSSGGKRSK